MKALFQNRVVAIALTAVVVLGCLAYGWSRRPATVPSPDQGDWVYDGAGVLSSNTEFALERCNRNWDTDYGFVTAVATVDHTRGWELDDYTYALFDNWGLGDQDAILVLDTEAREYWMSPGAKLDVAVGETALRALFEESFLPSFRAGDYDGAIQKLLNALDACYAVAFGSAGDYQYNGISYPAGSVSTRESGGMSLVGFLIILVLVFLIFSAIDKSRYRRWAANGGSSAINRASFIPLLFWHRPGGSWFRSMEARYRSGGPGYRGGGPSHRSGSSFRSSSGSHTSSSYRSSSSSRSPFRSSSYTRSGFGGSASSRSGYSSSRSSFGGSRSSGGSSRGGGSRGGFGGR